jgi:hypothetical protein
MLNNGIQAIQVEDRNGDGYIDRKEFFAALKENNVNLYDGYQIKKTAYINANMPSPSSLALDYSNYLDAEDGFNAGDIQKDQTWSGHEIEAIFAKYGRFQIRAGGSIAAEVISSNPVPKLS